MNFSIDTFMTRGLHLSKTELLVYALIHNFSQDGQGCFWGSMANTADNLNCSETSVKNAIKSLLKRNLIKAVGFHPEYHTVQYIAIVPAGIKEKFAEGSKIAEGGKICTPKGAKIVPRRGQKLTPIIKNDNKDIIKEVPDLSIDIDAESLQDKMRRYENA